MMSDNRPDMISVKRFREILKEIPDTARLFPSRSGGLAVVDREGYQIGWIEFKLGEFRPVTRITDDDATPPTSGDRIATIGV